MKIGEHDHVVGAWAEAPSGPGWSNRIVWVCIRNAADGSHRVDALQPEEQGDEIPALFPVCLACSAALIRAVERLAAEVRRAAPRRRRRSTRRTP